MFRDIRSVLLCALAFVGAGSALGDDWRTLRGPHSDGSGAGVVGETGKAAFELVWKHSIGEGYSGVTVAAGRAVSAFSDGENDVVVAWSAADGRELWRTTIGPTYRGHDGSSDGPVATPTLTDERVYMVGPHGDLLALVAATGEVVWRRHLVTDWGATDPMYGFGTIPLEVDGVLVVTVGAEDNSVVGLDPADGKQLWVAGFDRIGYSAPVVVVGSGSGGARHVLVAGSQHLAAIDPRTGRQLWTFQHSERPSGDPTYPQLQLVGDRVLLSFPDAVALYDLKPTADGMQVAEAWRSTAFKRTTALPVAVGEHLYGYNGTFLTCIALDDGEIVWKSRFPRGHGLIRLDDQLVVLGSGGVLAMGRADPAGYRSTATLPVSDHGGYTSPSFADGRVYVRNLSEIAAVAVRADGEQQMLRVVRKQSSRGLDAALERIRTADDPDSVVAAFLAEYGAFPIVEPGWVHFVFVDEGSTADSVAVIGQMNDGDMGDAMRRVGRTNLFVRSYPAESGGRFQYRFQVDFADPQPDPLNPLAAGGVEGLSEVLLDGFVDPAFVTEPATATGRLETLTVTSATFRTDVPVELYLPSGYDADLRYPLVVMPNGRQWIEAGEIVPILDRLFETRSRSAIVALVPMSNWVAGSWGTRAVTFLGNEVLPAIEAAYPIAESVDARSLWTVEDKAAVGVTLASEMPEAFGRFAFQSPLLYFQQLPAIATDERRPAFWVSWSRYEITAPETGTDNRAEAMQLVDALRAAGLPVEGGEFIPGPGYRTWRTEADAILTFLLGNRS